MPRKRLKAEYRLKQLILYVLSKVPAIEIPKLQLILWKADTQAYRDLGQSITGVRYIAAKEGPRPEGFFRILANLVRSKRVTLERKEAS
jgi:hypothetical protein